MLLTSFIVFKVPLAIFISLCTIFSVPLQFDSVDSATLAAGLLSMEYDDCEVYLEQMKAIDPKQALRAPKEVPCAQVRVSSLPQDFSTVSQGPLFSQCFLVCSFPCITGKHFIVSRIT